MTTADEREFLLQSLRDLDAERAAGDISAEDYDELRDDYTARAAAALRGGPEAPVRRRRPWLVLSAIVAVAVSAGLIVAHSAGQRLPNGALTGSISASPADRLAEAQRLIGQGKAVEAIKAYDAVLRDDPRNAEALAYRGWLLRLAGLPDDGLRYIDRAITADPNYPDARFFRGMILWKDKHDPAAAVVEFQRFLAANPPPDRAAAVQDALAQAQAEASAPQHP